MLNEAAVLNELKPVDPKLIEASQQLIADAMSRHKRPLLKFSGGKDSLACLYLLRPYWDRLTVLWTNPGDAYPETIEQMRRISKLVPNFVEVVGPGYVRRHGIEQTFPVDMVPWAATAIGRACKPESPRFQLHSFFDCCAANVWRPMQEKVQELGIDLVIRGERHSEAYRPPISSGFVDPQNGGTQLMPLWSWSKEDVFAFLRAEDVAIPRSYAYGMGSLDCMHCTAALTESGNKLRYLRNFHPAAAEEFERRLRLIRDEQARHFRLVQVALGEIEPAQGEGFGD